MRFGGRARGKFRLLVSAAGLFELRAELFQLRVKHRVAKHPLPALDKTRVLALQVFERAIGFRKPPGNILPRMDRRRVLRLQFGEQFFAVADVRLEPDIDGIPLAPELVALDDQCRQLLFEGTALLTERARQLLAILEDGVALAAEIRGGLRVLALEFLKLPAKAGKLHPRGTARVERRLDFADLILFRRQRLFERSDARLGLDHSRLALRTVLLRLLLETDLPVLKRLNRRGLLVLKLAHFRDLRLRLRLDFARGLFRLRPCGVAFEDEDFQTLAVSFDFLFQTLDGPRVHDRHFVGGRVGFRETRFEIGGVFAGVFQFGADDAVLIVKRGGLVLEFLERLPDFGILLLRLGLDFLAHFGFRRLHVKRGVLLALVGGGQEFFRLGTGVLFAGKFQRRFALRGFQRLDAAVQFLHGPIVFALRAVGIRCRPRLHRLAGLVGQVRGAPVGNLGDLRGEKILLLEQRVALGLEFGDPVGIAKRRDLTFQAFDFLMPLLQFLLHLLPIAHGFFRQLLSE